jgi:hypothetical protein
LTSLPPGASVLASVVIVSPPEPPLTSPPLPLVDPPLPPPTLPPVPTLPPLPPPVTPPLPVVLAGDDVVHAAAVVRTRHKLTRLIACRIASPDAPGGQPSRRASIIREEVLKSSRAVPL